MFDQARRWFPFAIAIVLPPAGLILGVLALSQEERELGVQLILVAVVAAAAWVLLLTM